MQKIIQNYSILIFPALIGCAMLMTFGGIKDFPLYVAVWGTIGTITILAPMLFLSKCKIWYIRLLYGFIGIILFYVLIFLLHIIFLGLKDFKDIIIMGYVVVKGSFWCLVEFYPANIAVILCFLLNDIYAKKIGKLFNKN